MIEVTTTTLELRTKPDGSVIPAQDVQSKSRPALKVGRPKVVTKGERDAANAQAFKASLLVHLIKRLKEIEGVTVLELKNQEHDVSMKKVVERNVTETINATGFNPYQKSTKEKLNLYIVADIASHSLKVPEIHKLTHKQREYAEQATIYLKSNDINTIIASVRALT